MQIIKNIWLLVLLNTLFLGGCGNTYLSEQELIKFIDDTKNGLRNISSENGVEIDLAYRPTCLFLSQNYKNETVSDKDSIGDELSKFIYFVLKISFQGQEYENKFVGDAVAFSNVISYLGHEFSQHITLTSTSIQDDINVADYVYIRMFNTNKATTILIAFEAETIKDSKNFTIHIRDSKLGLGHHHFMYQTKELLKAPKIRI